MMTTKDIKTVDITSYSYIFGSNVSISLKNGSGGPIRCNIYIPRSTKDKKSPVLVTYGPYGKDIPYKDFNPESFGLLNPEHQTEHSSWETPTPSYWTKHGYVVIRADELGSGQSPGVLNPLTAQSTFNALFELIEWASEQTWSSGKVGLLGISYYGATQWQVAARRPKGLSAMIPWEGFSDLYRDANRHGGILSSKFFNIWWHRQVAPNQYGLPGRAEHYIGLNTVDGDLSEEQLRKNRVDQPVESARIRYRDDPRFTSVNINLEDIQVPLLSVANWGGIGLHLRGNVYGFMHASSEFKYLRFIVGRHDLPFYSAGEVDVQRSFLDAFLKGDDQGGWSTKDTPAIDLLLRTGNGDPQFGDGYARRAEKEWPLLRTQYTKLFLSCEGALLDAHLLETGPARKLTYKALGTAQSPNSISFSTRPFNSETEITGHITAHLNVSVSANHWGPTPSDIDVFLTLRHISPSGEEVFYCGSIGDAVPITRGFLRVSLRKINASHPSHREWLPHRDYYSTDVQPVIPNEVYAVDVEVWPTNVVIQAGGCLVLEISSGDTANTGVFEHNDPLDRSAAVFQGLNHIHFGPAYSNYLTLPIIPRL